MSSMDVDVDALLERFLQHWTKHMDITKQVNADDIITLARMAKSVFQSQPVLLELDTPICVCGDIHGQYTDLLRIFNKLGQPPITNYLFLGDYVDRGPMNLETIVLLFCYKVKYSTNFFLLRGNHETSSTNAVYGFKDEIDRRYPSRGQELWKAFNETFASMPLSAIIGDRVLCMHGGLSPLLRTRDQLRDITRGWLEPSKNTLEMDLLWADPEPTINGWKPSMRGCSYLFGNDVILDICRKLDVDLVVRAHQVVQDGYEMSDTQMLVTIFSAPNYCNGEFDNAGSIMYIDKSLTVSFIQFAPSNSAGGSNRR